MNCQIVKLPSNHLYVFVFFYRLRRKKKITKRIDNIKKIRINLKNKKINKNYDNYKINSLLNNLNCFNLQKFKTIINLKSINQISKLTLIKKLQRIQFYLTLLNNFKINNHFIKNKLINKIKIELQDLNIILKNCKKIYYFK